MEEANLRIQEYRRKQKLTLSLEDCEDDNMEEDEDKENSSNIEEAKSTEDEFNSALSTLLAENNWKLVSTKTGKYKVQFKPTLNYKERINILEIVLEDIRERYLDLRCEYQKIKRRCGRKNRKRKRGS